MSQGQKVEGGWVGSGISGQEPSMFWDSQGSQKCKARSVLFFSCGHCGRGLAGKQRDGTATWPRECDNCHWLNHP